MQKELELAKVDAQKKISEVENREVRTANNLKAELSFTKAHLRTAQQKETVLADELVEPAIEAIVSAARTEKIGDGKIFVLPVEQAIRIRTGETGDDAV